MKVARFLVSALVGIVASSQASAQVGHAAGSDPSGRFLAVISDHHMGIGRNRDGRWSHGEDFRWPRALGGFLDFLSQRGNHAVDLVIAGDLVELWQPPAEIQCIGESADLGCTEEEMTSLATIVAREHADELALLAEFAARGDNRIHLIPGNHDSTLLLEPVWQKFSVPLGSDSGRVSLVRSGVWASADGQVVVEHGHQIGADVNGYKEWPQIVRSSENGTSYVVRPWGERFVQRVFNEQEANYPVIDNLSPVTAGLRYRMEDRGIWGTTADMARFLVFNLFETSIAQKSGFLGPRSGESDAARWKVETARGSGHKLFVAALREGDPFRQQLLAADYQAVALRQELDALVKDKERLPDAELFGLCDLAAAGARDGWTLCRPAHLGALLQLLVPLNEVLREHLRERGKQYKEMTVFIYGHTHQMQKPWSLRVSGTVSVMVSNSGAFQRLVDEEGFLQRVKARSWTEQEGLRRLTPEDLAPCYGAILVPYVGNRPTPETLMWRMAEDANEGELVSPGDSSCG